MRLPTLISGDRRYVFYRLLLNGLIQGVLAVCFAWLVMYIFDRLGGSMDEMPVFFAALTLTVLSSAWLRRNERIQAEALGQHYVRAVRQRLYRHLLSSNPRDFKRGRKGAMLLKFVGDLSALRRWVSLGLARLLVAGLAVTIAVVAMSWLHWPFAVGVSAVLAVAASWILCHSAELRAAIAETRQRQARLASNVTETLNNLTTVQAFGESGHEQQLMRRHSDRLMQAAVRKARKIGSLRAVIDATTGISVLMVLVLASILPPSEISPGMLAAAISIIGFLTPPLRELGRAQEYWLAAKVARANIVRISQSTRRVRERRNRPALRLTDGAIEFKGVSVRGALSGINARVAGGARIAVIGGNGSGKSTLLGLVGRLFDADKGRVLIDGQDISRVRLSSLRARVAYVSAEVPLVRGSLRKNLCYGAGKVAPDRLKQVSRACELEGLIRRLPRGLEAKIAEGGSSLSQGERVRVALARALLRRPGILVLDEADANLDGQARQALDRNVRGFPGTVLMASHRRSVLRTCDTLWMLRDGRLEACADLDDEANIIPIGVDVEVQLSASLHEQGAVRGCG